MTTDSLSRRLHIQTIVLFALYAMAALLSAVKFLPIDPQAVSSLPYHHIGGLRNLLLDLTIWTALLAGGLALARSTPAANTRYPIALLWLVRAWTALLIIAGLTGLLAAQEGRYLLELPPILDVALILLAALFVVIVLGHPGRGTAVFVWAAGMLLALVCLGISLIPAADPAQDRVLRAVAVGLRYHVGYVVAALALAWASAVDVRRLWPLPTVAGIAAAAGTVIALGPLAAVGAIPLHGLFPALALIALAAALFLAVRGPALPQASALVAAGGILGVLIAIPAAGADIQGTGLSDLVIFLTAAGVILLAGLGGEGSTERGGGARYLLVTGVLVAGLAALLAGVVQVYLERVLSVGYLDTQNALTPLFIIWAGGLAILWIAAFWMTLVRMRQPQI